MDENFEPIFNKGNTQLKYEGKGALLNISALSIISLPSIVIISPSVVIISSLEKRGSFFLL